MNAVDDQDATIDATPRSRGPFSFAGWRCARPQGNPARRGWPGNDVARGRWRGRLRVVPFGVYRFTAVYALPLDIPPVVDGTRQTASTPRNVTRRPNRTRFNGTAPRDQSVRRRREIAAQIRSAIINLLPSMCGTRSELVGFGAINGCLRRWGCE
jgi:hypothetical protein